MYCTKCFSDLSEVTASACPKCGKAFDRERKTTFLDKPFPRTASVVGHVIMTTIAAVVVAFVVAFFQMTRSSGH